MVIPVMLDEFCTGCISFWAEFAIMSRLNCPLKNKMQTRETGTFHSILRLITQVKFTPETEFASYYGTLK